MTKRIIISFINGFCYSIAITMTVQAIVMFSQGGSAMLPEYTARFDNELTAFASQLLLVGLMSGITSAGTAVFEARRIGLLAQSVLFLFIMLSVWIPVACICWGFHRYLASMLSTIASIVVTYGIIWGIIFRLSKKDIDAINAKLSEKEE